MSLHFPMTDPRAHSNFAVIRRRLQQTLGKRFGLPGIVAFIREIARAHRRPLPRDAARKKDAAIEWACLNIDVVGPHLLDCELPDAETAADLRVRASLNRLPEVNEALTTALGHKPAMPELLEIAASVGIPDREAKRNKKLMLCWFAENWERFNGILYIVTKTDAFDIGCPDTDDATVKWIRERDKDFPIDLFDG
jgi:hypothetical protein